MATHLPIFTHIIDSNWNDITVANINGKIMSKNICQEEADTKNNSFFILYF